MLGASCLLVASLKLWTTRGRCPGTQAGVLCTGQGSAASGAALPEGGAPASASEPGTALGSPPASLGAPAQAVDDGGGLDLAQGGLTWSGDLDLPGSLTCPSLTAGLFPVSTRHVRVLACAAMQQQLPDL